MAGSIYVCGTCGGALGRPERDGAFAHRTTPNCGREPAPMLRHVLEERLRLGEDVTGHGRRRDDPLAPGQT
jgi:hypothetical protein